MTKGQTYRLTCSIFAILSPPDGSRHPITIPQDSCVLVVGGPLNGNRLVEVEWEDRQFLAFTADVRACGYLTDSVEVGT
jgi:hypothetical protein